ncbi:MAG: hypothetical protein AB7P03_19415 [Kofleriaceae bacterium]
MIRTLMIAGGLALTTASSTAAPAAMPPVDQYVLIVTNNRSSALGRPDLSYADDDGAKYYEVFRTAIPESHIRLLTELDRDTARLFPSLAAVIQPPTTQNVWNAANELARAVAASRREGRAVELTFVFAGHGDVDAGRGFLELRDGPFTSQDVERLFSTVSATRSHVILDSCNSFFVINARKPGGRRFATPTDAAESLSKRLPNVGVFLSTSAEAEVFEWSELQSGIFSHAVRSGLSGAADANGDGVVSYEELAAFVEVATSEVKNPSYRPKVFARGPGGDADAALFSPGHASVGQLELDRDRQLRVTVRDADELPWIDVLKEAGAPMTLQLPARLGGGTIEEAEITAGGASTVARRTIELAPESGAVSTTALALAEPSRVARGPADLFRMLFTRPFGPRALAAYRLAEAHQPAQVFGVSSDDLERMNLLVTEISGEERRNKLFGNAALIGAGSLSLGFGIAILRGYTSTDLVKPDETRTFGWTMVGIGAGAAIAGAVMLARPSPAERLKSQFHRDLATGRDPSIVLADADRQLREIAADYRRARRIGTVAGVGLGVLGVAGLVMQHHRHGHINEQAWLAQGSLVFSGALGAVLSTQEYPIERMAKLWSADPATRRLPQLSIVPAEHGVVVGAAGQF